MSAPTLIDRQRLIFASNRSQQEKLLLLALALHIGNNGECWPAVKTLAKECSLSPRRINAHLKSLTHDGVISTRRRRNESALRSISWKKLSHQDVTQTAHPTYPEYDTSSTSRMRHRRHPDNDADGASGCDASGAQKDQRKNNGKPLKGFPHIVHHQTTNDGGSMGDPLGEGSPAPSGIRWSGGGITGDEMTRTGTTGLQAICARAFEAVAEGWIDEGDITQFIQTWCNVARRFRDKTAKKPIKNPGAVLTSLIWKKNWRGSKTDKSLSHRLLVELKNKHPGKPLLNAIMVEWESTR